MVHGLLLLGIFFYERAWRGAPPNRQIFMSFMIFMVNWPTMKDMKIMKKKVSGSAGGFRG